MRWWLLLLVPLIPTASAFGLSDVRMDFVESWNPADTVAAPPPPEDESPCGGGVLEATDSTLTFREADTGNVGMTGLPPGLLATSCAEALWRLTPPANATTAEVSFRASRSVAEPSGLNSTVVAPQYLALWEEMDGNHAPDLQRVDYIASGARSQAPAQFSATFNLPGEGLLLHFEDQSVTAQSVTSLGTGQSVTMSVSDLVVRYRDVPWSGAAVETTEQSDGHNLTTLRTVRVQVPENTTGDLRLHVNDPGNLASARGPAATIHLERLDIRTSGTIVTFSVPGAAISEQGPGEYVLRFASVTPLPPPPIKEPVHVLVLYVAAMLLTPLAFIPATRGAVGLRRLEGSDVSRAIGAGLLVALASFALLYLLQLIYTAAFIGIDAMTRIPLATQPLTLYVQIVFLAALVALVAVVSGRRLRRGIAADVAAKEEQARLLAMRNEELSHFAYVASHDLQEPLRKVAGFTTLLKSRYGDQVDAEGREFMDFAVDGAERMKALIQGLLQYARAGEDGLKVRSVALQELAAQAVASLDDGTREATTITPMATASVDPILMGQVFQNLVGNAAKFRDPDRPLEVVIRSRPEGDSLRVEVQDNGIGIAPEQQARVFRMFQRLHAREAYEGMGIGLALCTKIVAAHGGTLGVDSEAGVGSTFWFTLPGNGS